MVMDIQLTNNDATSCPIFFRLFQHSSRSTTTTTIRTATATL